jgi:hypothetical protein
VKRCRRGFPLRCAAAATAGRYRKTRAPRAAAWLRRPASQLAVKLSVSLTAVRHAGTGRLWQARGFWQPADQLPGGILPDMYDGRGKEGARGTDRR